PMCPSRSGRAAFPFRAPIAGVLSMIVVLGGSGTASAQKTAASTDEPRLPGTISRVPDWAGPDAPFDLKAYFAPVPAGRNAAPLYLDALFEFGHEVEFCFPPGPERNRRAAAARERMARYMKLLTRMREDESAVSDEDINAVIAAYAEGFRKVAEAQKRDRCDFGLTIQADGIVAHAQAARQVARIAALRVGQAVKRGDFDAAIDDVRMVLRLSRDLRPHGVIIDQLIADAIVAVVYGDLAKTILAAPRLRVTDCDRLLKVFLDHEARGSDGYVEGLHAEYLFGLAATRRIYETKSAPVKANLANLEQSARESGDFYRAMLALNGQPYAPRLAAAEKLARKPGGAQIAPTLAAFVQASGRTVATLRATECLIVMRRWELKHRGLPRALLLPVKEAGLKAIPLDPYDGQPMRVAVFEGDTVVYSVGKDGRDDKGQRDSRFDTQSGDLIFRTTKNPR
ncbi:MAG: hypothetical protein ACYC61_22770, partial [Isosphaeraceae bacterium]